MGYVIYLRKSRADLEAEAHGEGETLARHRKMLLEVAQKQKLVVDKIYEELVSGETIAARPVMQRLLHEVEQGMWEGVLVMEVERLARGDTIDQGLVARAFQYSATRIVTPLKNYNPLDEFDEEYFEFGLFMSRREYKAINRRLQRGRVASVKEGKYVGSRAPYGYRREKLKNDKGYTLLPVAEQAQTVRIIFDWFTKGGEDSALLNVTDITRRLNHLAIPSAEGGQWRPSTVSALLKNPVYAGRLRWGYRSQKREIRDGGILAITRPLANSANCLFADGMQEVLISEEQFLAAQKRFKEKIKPGGAPRTLKNPFAGLLICAQCGKPMTRRPQKKGQPYLICTTPGCQTVGVGQENLEKAMLVAMKHWFDGWDLLRVTQNHNEDKKAAEFAHVRQRELQKRKERIHLLLEEGIYSPDCFAERICKIDRELSKLEDCSRENLLDEQELSKSIVENYYRIKQAKERNSFLKLLFVKLEYQKSQSGRWHTDPSAFELILYPRLPPCKDSY